MRARDIAQLLPEVYRGTLPPEGDPGGGADLLALLLEVMERMHAPVETLLDQLDAYWRPGRTPDAFLPFLASWLDLDELFGGARPPSGAGRLRDVLAHAPELLRMRGTEAGLLRFLELATGRGGFRLDPAGDPAGGELPFAFDLVPPPLPPAELELVRRIVRYEKPAHVVVTVVPSRAAADAPTG